MIGKSRIEIHLSSVNPKSWIIDLGCGSPLCTDKKKLRNSRNLGKNEIVLRIGNDAKVAAVAIGTCVLTLPPGLMLELEECYYVPALTRNII